MTEVAVYPIKNRKSAFKNFTYLIKDARTSEAVIVDPAGDLSQLLEEIAATASDIKAVLLTHYHDDHINLAGSVSQKYHLPVYMSKSEVDAYGFRCQNLEVFEEEFPLTFSNIYVKPFFTPGHTKGSTCYQIADNLFSGDTLFIEGCGLCHGYGASPEAMYYSLKKLVEYLPKDIRIYPGHSYGELPGVSFDYLLDNNIYLNINNIDQFVAFRMRRGHADGYNFK